MPGANPLQALPRDVPNYHSRQAAHLRALAGNATTDRVKTRLLQEAERHELIAHGVEEASAACDAPTDH